MTQIGKKKKDFAVVNSHILACAMLHNVGLELGDNWEAESNSDGVGEPCESDASSSDRVGFQKREQPKRELFYGLD
ncbi:unnamed protein product [Phytophthora fragariaefolia]|uniref:Unnamed protein product n=1 Tax=Phytophthora fragariaefolia TaxID=1490495 RepID=A0A9W6Y018_9STRA|nr:unnamed protein product [Phytophthora fragariaefolia]